MTNLEERKPRNLRKNDWFREKRQDYMKKRKSYKNDRKKNNGILKNDRK